MKSSGYSSASKRLRQKVEQNEWTRENTQPAARASPFIWRTGICRATHWPGRVALQRAHTNSTQNNVCWACCGWRSAVMAIDGYSHASQLGGLIFELGFKLSDLVQDIGAGVIIRLVALQ